ncbi:MAG TPA: acyl carrier protein [Bryobacteraceae bacterium]|jgi:acyl carrier protein|nr:acyl carrier protein [Bryobacteraceae bacterium]
MSNQEKIVAIIRQVSGKSSVPDGDESLFESGYLDSFALPDMVSAIEAEFGIAIPDSDLTPRKFDSIARIESYIEARS